MLSCHSTPGRRGHIRRATAGIGFFGLLKAASFYPALRLGRPRPRGPEAQLFHVLHPIQENLGPLCYTGSAVIRAGPR